MYWLARRDGATALNPASLVGSLLSLVVSIPGSSGTVSFARESEMCIGLGPQCIIRLEGGEQRAGCTAFAKHFAMIPPMRTYQTDAGLGLCFRDVFQHNSLHDFRPVVGD